MFDRIINILVIEWDAQERSALLGMLKSPGHNIFVAATIQEAYNQVEANKFIIIFCNLDFPACNPSDFIAQLHAKNLAKNSTLIITSVNREVVYENVGDNDLRNAVDYLIKPYVKNLVRAKTNVYKKLHFKHERVSQLLESILPSQILSEYRNYGKSSPKKRSNCTVMFTDFDGFSQKTKDTDAQTIVRKLDEYFSKFDLIIKKYNLEKIKTIGDAYMVVGGVTEDDPYPAIRTALAAIELRNFVATEIETNKALNRDFWEMRIGIHSGDLVAGVVGEYKFSFDVWGDTVNMAARCEQNSEPNQITISAAFKEKIAPYFECESRGAVAIKNGGSMEMFYLKGIKPNYSLDGEGRTFSIGFREEIGMETADFEGLRSFVLTKLKAELSENLLYHSPDHTLNVEKAIIKYAELEMLSAHEIFLLRTAGLFHDAGFLNKYEHNEEIGVQIFERYAPIYGYNKKDMNEISAIILSTSYNALPKNKMEAIMRDSDLDYLGRIDYHVIAKKLFDEMALHGKKMDDLACINMQIEYLENHHEYYTTSARNLRNPGKLRRIKELKLKRAQLLSKSNQIEP